jgi:DNA-binding NarL/FixJ family response regulator
MRIRVVLSEDNALLREGLSGLIRDVADLDLVSTTSSFDETVAAIDEVVPDVVLTDIRMPPTHTDEGVRIALHCRSRHPGMGVILLSQYVDPSYVRALLETGAGGRGYLLKERVADVDELVTSLGTVARGGSVVDPKVIETLVQARAARGDRSLDRLTNREREVLGEMAAGQSNASIAATLSISQRSVEKHINSIFSKLGVANDEGGHPRVRAVLTYLSETS